LLAYYRTGKLSILYPVKHWGLSLLPITKASRYQCVTCWNSITHLCDPLLSLNLTLLHVCIQRTYQCSTMKQGCFIDTTDIICKKVLKQVGLFDVFPLFSAYSISTVLAVWPSYLANSFDLFSIWTLQHTHHLVTIHNHWSRASSVFGFSFLCFSFLDVPYRPLWHACSFHSTSCYCMTLGIVNFGFSFTIDWWWLVLSGLLECGQVLLVSMWHVGRV
jgi:hypothetical protein